MRSAFLILCVVFGIAVVTFFVLRGPPLEQRLEQEISNQLPNETSKSAVAAWLESQPAKHDAFQASGADVAIERAGLKLNEVSDFILADYSETRWPSLYEIQVYFFFNTDGKLLKHWIFEREVAP